MYCVVLETATLSNINLWLGGEVMLELKSVKVIHLLMTTRQALRQLHCLSAPGIGTPAQGPRSLKALGRLVWQETGQGTPSEQNDSACMVLTKDVCREALFENTWEALLLLQVNTVVSL